MNYLKKRILRFKILKLAFLALILFISSCGKTSKKFNELPIRPISDHEIIAFQNAYGASFNEIAKAIEDETYYELKAREHIDNFYNFNEGKVIFKIGHDDDKEVRSSQNGLLSYLIGKNKKFPMDNGIAKENWRKIDWDNKGTILERDIAIIIGSVRMENDKGKIQQNFTMVLKRNQMGKIKLVAHKISIPCSK